MENFPKPLHFVEVSWFETQSIIFQYPQIICRRNDLYVSIEYFEPFNEPGMVKYAAWACLDNSDIRKFIFQGEIDLHGQTESTSRIIIRNLSKNNEFHVKVEEAIPFLEHLKTLLGGENNETAK